MTKRTDLGGVIHTYQKYDPQRFPSPTQSPPDFVSPAMEHLLAFGNMRQLSEEELARAIKLDPSQIGQLGPSLEMLRAILEERKRKILSTYETDAVQKQVRRVYQKLAKSIDPPARLRQAFDRAVHQEQIRDLERLWYAVDDDNSPLARSIVQLIDRLVDKYEIDELSGKYEFTGRTSMDIPKALAVKEELQQIDELLKQLEEAAKTAQIGVIDMEALAEFVEPGDMEQLAALRQQIENYLREMGERQGLEFSNGAFKLTPQAYRLFQGKLLERLFSQLQASRTGRHQGPIQGEGAVELATTKEYEFGDSVANMDIVGTLTNAILRNGPSLPIRLQQDDIQIHRTRNSPKCATCVLMDMSGSMRYDAQYINVKRMALALDGLIKSEYPGDYLQFIELFTFAKLQPAGEIVNLMPKVPTITNPVVRYWVDMSKDDVSEALIPPHFTNIQHGLSLARRLLSVQDTPNRQVILITDGLPTAHFEGEKLYLLYPPDEKTEEATLREAAFCQREGITINIFLVPSWSQSEEDIRFAHRLAESTKGRVFFTAGKDLDRYVVWDYVNNRREVLG
jgi:uncharacterized protein with von Willebrand factor type A (vWA) domain